MRAVALVLLAACGRSETKQPTAQEVQGTLSLDGKPLTVTTCRAGRGVTTYVELVTAAGKLRFEDQQLFWSAKDFGKGDKLACDRLDRSWGGGMRTDGTAYFRGHLIFACSAPVAVAGDITVDCGKITPEERAQLDKNRRDFLDERCGEIDKRAGELGVVSRCREDKWSSEVQGCVLGVKDAVAWNACVPSATLRQ